MAQLILQSFQFLPLFRIRRFLLFALFFSIIIQTGKHFWPGFAFVSGIRVDYISPTLYFSDLVIFGLFLLEVYVSLKSSEWKPFFVGAIIFLLFFPYVFFAGEAWGHLYGVLTLLKFVFVGYVVARRVRAGEIQMFLYALAFGVLIESLLVFGQFLFQESVQGPFYFLGERAISPTTIGAATFSLFGHEALRAYGTFPHPNVLAFFLYFSNVFLILSYKKYKNITFIFSAFLGSIALFFTFSRVTMLLYGGFLLYYFFQIRKKYLAFVVLLIFVLYTLLFSSRFALGSLVTDLTYRKELFDISFAMLSDSFIFGSGFGNYFYEQIQYHREISPIFLQPVHNIYILVVLQIGIVGLVGAIYLFGKTLYRAYSNLRHEDFFDTGVFILVFSVFFIGIFDHFLVTLHQGQLMMAILIGFVWRKTSKQI